MDEIEDFKSKYMRRLDKELGGASQSVTPITSKAYLDFKSEYLPKHLSFYEKAARLAGKVLKVNPGKKKIEAYKKAIDITHLAITPMDAVSLGIFAPLIFIMVAATIGYVLPFMVSPGAEGGSTFLLVFGFVAGLAMVIPLQRLPFFFSNNWRMKASNQMVLSVFYIVTYMRHTSNLELAVDFAAEHLSPPLSLDLKKVIWDIETGKFDSLKDSLDHYLRTWEDWNKEYIESMHLIESSLFENSETRRLDALDKALSVMLNETYERMLHYAHNLKSPLQALHMLGIVLPILGLVILPLMVSFIPEVQWYHVMIIYNMGLPFGVYYLGKNILSKRPTGYGETNMMETSKEYDKFKKVIFKMGKKEMKVTPIFFSLVLFGTFFMIGISPLLLHAANPGFDWVMTSKEGIKAISASQDEGALFYFLGYRPQIKDGELQEDLLIGPFGIGATMLSLFLPLAFGLSLGFSYKLRTKNMIKIRKEAKKLEEEFASALFQLGNRLGDGIPAEIAFEKVAMMMKDTTSGKFFMLVSINIRKLGMGLEPAIFDKHQGALTYFPSNLIESSMKVLVQASKKGPLVASQALINVSEYIKQMHRVDERLKDLMADIVSDMKSQIAFLTPAIAGIVVGITSMITKILGSLGMNISNLQGAPGASAGFGTGLMGMFGTGIPTYWFQAIVGIYVVQVVVILTIMVNGIENGADKLLERYMLGHALVRTTITYVLIAGIVMLIFNLIAGSIVAPFAVTAAGG
ncbi:hypothetical protein ACFL1B_03985 [Nanoarchaeota archaeon]